MLRGGREGESASAQVARVLDLIDQSGLPYQLTPMGTKLEGEWDEVMGDVTACYRELERDSARISVNLSRGRWPLRHDAEGPLDHSRGRGTGEYPPALPRPIATEIRLRRTRCLLLLVRPLPAPSAADRLRLDMLRPRTAWPGQSS